MKKMIIFSMVLILSLFASNVFVKADAYDFSVEFSATESNQVLLKVKTDIKENGTVYIDIQNGLIVNKDSFKVDGKSVNVKTKDLEGHVRVILDTIFKPGTEIIYSFNSENIIQNKTYTLNHSIRTERNSDVNGWKVLKITKATDIEKPIPPVVEEPVIPEPEIPAPPVVEEPTEDIIQGK